MVYTFFECFANAREYLVYIEQQLKKFELSKPNFRLLNASENESISWEIEREHDGGGEDQGRPYILMFILCVAGTSIFHRVEEIICNVVCTI